MNPLESVDHNKMYQSIRLIFLLLYFSLAAFACKNKSGAATKSGTEEQTGAQVTQKLPVVEVPQAVIPIRHSVAIGNFFTFIDEIVRQNDTLSSYKLSEHLLLRANPWLLDSLVISDYYFQMSLGHFVYDQRKWPILEPGDSLLIPGPKTAAALLEKIAKTRLDVNIPAFNMRILEGDSVVCSIPVRVGKNQRKYLAMAGGMVDLRTHTGSGEIIRVNRNPMFFDPVTGDQFKFTKRDDHRITYMPQIPWLEPMINGGRYGQLIHPTTNPRTLGKAASNGCIGVSEADGWRVYFYAPEGTKILIRYDVEEINSVGDTLRFKDIYGLKRSQKVAESVSGAGVLKEKTPEICICDSIF